MHLLHCVFVLFSCTVVSVLLHICKLCICVYVLVFIYLCISVFVCLCVCNVRIAISALASCHLPLVSGRAKAGALFLHRLRIHPGYTHCSGLHTLDWCDRFDKYNLDSVFRKPQSHSLQIVYKNCSSSNSG